MRRSESSGRLFLLMIIWRYFKLLINILNIFTQILLTLRMKLRIIKELKRNVVGFLDSYTLVQKGEIMAIRSTLSSMMGKYRYTIQYVHEQTGLARNTISNLYNDKATRIDFDTLDRLCSFFECDIADILSKGESESELALHKDIAR